MNPTVDVVSGAASAPEAGPPPEASVVAHGRILQLDGLRAIAILAVLVRHVTLWPILWVGVDIFFALSGFLITGILLARKKRKDGYFSYFYRRRVFRILPSYIVSLIIFGLIWSFHSIYPWPAFVFMLMNMNDLFWKGGPVPIPIWSLAVEEQFYLVWPFIILWFSEKTLFRVAIAVLALTPVLRFIAAPHFPNSLYIYYLTPFRADVLCAGAALALLWKDRTPQFEELCRKRAWVGAVAGFGGLGAVQILPSMRLVNNGSMANAVDFSLSALGSVSLLAWALADKGWLLKLLTWRPLRFVGQISYTMYLVHLMVFILLGRVIHSHLKLLVPTVAGTVLWATVSWFVVEQPMMDLGAGKWGRKKLGKPASVAV